MTFARAGLRPAPWLCLHPFKQGNGGLHHLGKRVDFGALLAIEDAAGGLGLWPVAGRSCARYRQSGKSPGLHANWLANSATTSGRQATGNLLMSHQQRIGDRGYLQKAFWLLSRHRDVEAMWHDDSCCSFVHLHFDDIRCLVPNVIADHSRHYQQAQGPGRPPATQGRGAAAPFVCFYQTRLFWLILAAHPTQTCQNRQTNTTHRATTARA